MSTADSMYERAYFEIQAVLDEVLGTEDEGSAGGGIVADVRLALQRAEQKGHRVGLSRAAEIANSQADMQAPDFRPGYSERTHAVAVRIRDEICAELAGTEVPR